MKVALVYPEVYDLAHFKEQRKEFPPFGVLYLAALLEENNIKVSIFKICKSNTQCDFRNYDIVGFSIPSSATYGIVKESRFRSVYGDNPTIIVGGVHPSFFPRETLVDLRADVVAIGCGEKTILEIVGSHDSKDFTQINGICCTKDKSVIVTPIRSLDQGIDWLPFPARHLLDESDFIMDDRLANTNLRMTHVMLSRGCPFSCHFCAVLQKKIQYRTGGHVRMELEHLKRKYLVKGFAIVDDNFIVNKKAVGDVCISIKDLDLKWSALSRVDTVDYELLETMHEAGCIELKFGVESGSERILRAMGKNISVNQIRNAITLASSAGIGIKIFLVHGFPGENLITTRETISLLRDIGPAIERISLFRFVPLPGSYVYKNAHIFSLNIDATPRDWEKFHIYENNHHWWGSKDDFRELETAYAELEAFISDNWKG